MNDAETLLRYSVDAMLLCLYISLPIVAVSALVGLVVSVLQAATSIQDQTIPHAAKLVAVTIVIAIIAPVAGQALLRFATEMTMTVLTQGGRHG